MKKVVFTNGCFDLLHPGHIDLLRRARALGDKLIVGINSDRSIARIKGDGRPFVDQESRRAVLLGLESVDEVEIFDETTPAALIERIGPDVLVKGGDWPISDIVGAETVLARGGEVQSLPLVEGFSSSGIVDRIRAINKVESHIENDDHVTRSIAEHNELFAQIAATQLDIIRECADILADTFERGNKVLVCGNGGSAADAQHIAAEFVGRYETERRSLPSIALTTDTSALTAISNDYGFERVFARQVEGLAVSGDCLIAISTSGNSPNVIAAVMEARSHGCRVIGLTGKNGKKLAGLSDACVLVPSTRTARIQETHITIAHIWCEAVDQRISK
ncbi:MAG: SIS domain-containing protein [Pyrinomonadaceae bacterium]|nr:SIS domain-containing protein [Pyrinomonadaceae bacterium]MBP6212768.1 SIS domain-containing protein [Pyrinomonadaceae bacterium]